MKKYICIILSVLLTLPFMCACNAEATVHDTLSDDVTSNADESCDGIPYPQNPGNGLVEFIPGREIYINCENIDTVQYSLGEYGFSFEIISTKQLDPERIQLSIPCENEYTYSVSKVSTDLRKTEYSAGYGIGNILGPYYLPYYVYQNYCGTDFALAAKLWDLYINPPEAESEEIVEAEQLLKHMTPYDAYTKVINEAIDSYTALTADDIREFYVYSVGIIFSVDVEENITDILFDIDGQEIQHKIGKLRLVPSGIPSTYPYTNELVANSIPLLSFATNLYGNGMARVFLFDFTARRDATLLGIRFIDGVTELLDISLTITSGENTITTKWDGKSSIPLFEGDIVEINAVIQNENLSGLYYFENLNYELLIDIDNSPYSITNCLNMKPINMNYHEVFAIVFDGLNMESYYKDYYYPVFESWRAEYAD